MDKLPNNLRNLTGPVAVAGITAERAHNAWLKRQELVIKVNSQTLQKQEARINREAASQRKQIEHQKWLLQKLKTQQKIYENYNKQLITEEQKNELISELNSEKKIKSTSGKQNSQTYTTLKLTQNINTIKHPVLVSLNREDINKLSNNKNKYFVEQNYNEIESDNMHILPIEPYPYVWIIFSGILGFVAGVVAQKTLIGIYDLLVEIWQKIVEIWQKKKD